MTTSSEAQELRGGHHVALFFCGATFVRTKKRMNLSTDLGDKELVIRSSVSFRFQNVGVHRGVGNMGGVESYHL